MSKKKYNKNNKTHSNTWYILINIKNAKSLAVQSAHARLLLLLLEDIKRLMTSVYHVDMDFRLQIRERISNSSFQKLRLFHVQTLYDYVWCTKRKF